MRSLLNDGFDISEVLQLEMQEKKYSNGRFENFWKATQEVLDTENTVPHDRRQGTASCFIDQRFDDAIRTKDVRTVS